MGANNPFVNALGMDADKITIGQVLDWYEAHNIREYAQASLKERLRRRKLFADQFGHLLVIETGPSHLIEFIKSFAKHKSNWTKRATKAAINAPFNAAMHAGLIARNPFVGGVKIPEGKGGRDWTDDEYRKILRASHPYFKRLIIFIRFSGSRPGEARTLTWDEVRDDVDAIIKWEHKTIEATHEARKIHFNHVILKLLTWLRRNKANDRYVFVNKFGRPWTIKSLCKHLRMIRRRVGLPKEVVCHGGRHTFSTHALMNGVDLMTLSQLLGHRSVKTTERYIHLLNKRNWLNTAMNRAIGRG